MWLVEEAKKNMPLELDFLNEGHNAEKVANMLAHHSFLKVKTRRMWHLSAWLCLIKQSHAVDRYIFTLIHTEYAKQQKYYTYLDTQRPPLPPPPHHYYLCFLKRLRIF